jgi:hypothetical protein
VNGSGDAAEERRGWWGWVLHHALFGRALPRVFLTEWQMSRPRPVTASRSRREAGLASTVSPQGPPQTAFAQLTARNSSSAQ